MSKTRVKRGRGGRRERTIMVSVEVPMLEERGNQESVKGIQKSTQRRARGIK
jgi:hypothetical protein